MFVTENIWWIGQKSKTPEKWFWSVIVISAFRSFASRKCDEALIQAFRTYPTKKLCFSKNQNLDLSLSISDWLRYQSGMCFQLIHFMLKIRQRKLGNWELGLSLCCVLILSRVIFLSFWIFSCLGFMLIWNAAAERSLSCANWQFSPQNCHFTLYTNLNPDIQRERVDIFPKQQTSNHDIHC